MTRAGSHRSQLFPALLKHWRRRRGMSQLDLALAAEVSSRHLSFLETGRAQPSREMVLRLGAALDMPLREQNALLSASGFPEEFESLDLSAGEASAIADVIELMLMQHEPYPMLVMNPLYDVVRANAGAQRLVARMVADPAALGQPPNIFRLLFDPRLSRSFVDDWERVARDLLARLHRESLSKPANAGLAGLVRSLLEYPGVPADWRQPDFTSGNEPTLTVRLTRGELSLAFVTTMTVFSAPQNITLEELRIESYFPLDQATRAACAQMAAEES